MKKEKGECKEFMKKGGHYDGIERKRSVKRDVS